MFPQTVKGSRAICQQHDLRCTQDDGAGELVGNRDVHAPRDAHRARHSGHQLARRRVRGDARREARAVIVRLPTLRSTHEAYAIQSATMNIGINRSSEDACGAISQLASTTAAVSYLPPSGRRPVANASVAVRTPLISASFHARS